MAKITITATYELETDDPTQYRDAWEILDLVIEGEPVEIQVVEVDNR